MQGMTACGQEVADFHPPAWTVTRRRHGPANLVRVYLRTYGSGCKPAYPGRPLARLDIHHVRGLGHHLFLRHLVTEVSRIMGDYTTPLLDPAAIPQVALASMNQTHREEVELINRLAAQLAAAAQGKVDRMAITTAVTDWAIHTREHFERENALMESHGFPAYPVHRGEHDRMLSLIEGLRQAWLDNLQCAPLIEFIFTQWPEWFDNHVNSMDRVTAQFISMRS